MTNSNEHFPTPPPGQPQFLLYRTSDGASKVAVRLEGQTAWLTQAQMADLFQTTKQNISLHIQNVLEEKELPHEAVVKEYLTTAADGKKYPVQHYSLDMVLAIGYRVRSSRGTQFRQWATATLGEYLTKGFTLDDARLKQGKAWGADYFEELLARIRDIRASERRFYQQITDIYALSIDYDKDALITQEFYATVQNKLHWAIHGHTAAEVIIQRADAGKPNMGLTTWKNAPGGPIRKGDVGIAKNYLNKAEMESMNRIAGMYLDYAEEQAKRHVPMHMADWVSKLDTWLKFNEREVLANAGRVSAALAQEHAERELERFDQARLERHAATTPSDFDRLVAGTNDPVHQPMPSDTPERTKSRKKPPPKGKPKESD